MEGGSPSLIWQRWTLPMYRAQLRYWGDNPRLDQIARAYFKIKPKKTPPPQSGRAEEPDLDAALLYAPLTADELKALEPAKPR